MELFHSGRVTVAAHGGEVAGLIGEYDRRRHGAAQLVHMRKQLRE